MSRALRARVATNVFTIVALGKLKTIDVTARDLLHSGRPKLDAVKM